ncbi:hypothetical protein GCM10007387_57830 [Pseudoduganella albidiflava]|uniref:Bacteriophage tail tape measure N-terminal domain-containing protein n=1 Tax=Pseudoduganella albidiflava TaxID=321983 RepID=A0AA88C5W9_9BURK|nr:hypothetical protein GCM10007387_57830 [Pseudoduganella albidiflava]
MARQAIEEFERLRASASGSLQNVGMSGAQLSEALTGIGQRVVGVVATVVTLDAALGAMNNAINDLAALDDLAQKTGSSVETLSRLQQVAQTFGQDFAGVDSAVTKLAKGMAAADEDSSKVHKALKTLGISAKDAAGNMRDPAEVFIDISKNLQDYEDGAAKAALVNDALGKSGADLMPFLNDTAGSIERFTGVTQDAVDQAARFQDQTGELRAKLLSLATEITVAALPAVNDLLGAFIDTGKSADDLAGNDVTQWADDLGVGLARVADVAALSWRLMKAISGSFQAVWADVKLANTVLANANPIAAIEAWANGKSPNEAMMKGLAERNAVVEESNRSLAALWEVPANQFEQAFLKRVADRAAAKPDAPAPKKRPLTYQSSGAGEGSADVASARSDYESLNKSVADRLALLQAEIDAGRELSDSEKEIAKIQQGRLNGTVNLTEAEAAGLVTQLQQLDTMQKVVDGTREAAKQTKQAAEESTKKVKAAVEEAAANERLAATFGLSKGEIEELEVARLEEQRAQQDASKLTEKQIEDLDALIAAKKRNAEALSAVEGLESSKKALDDLNAFLDPAKAQTFGESLREAFGSAGEAISKVTGILDGYGKRQAEIDKQRKNALEALNSKQLDQMGYQKAVAELNDRETKNQLAGYGDMAGAAAGFFGEQSKGYQTLMAVSKVFHAAELAQTMAELVPKGIAAVLNQGTGDPYSAFARMAAMAAIVAGLGVAISGGGSGGSGSSGQSAAEVQAKQGTGSVLGDSEAQSKSIANSIELLEENSGDLIPINKEMLMALRSIDAAMTGLTGLIVQDATVATGDFASTGTTANRGAVGQHALTSTYYGAGIGPMGDLMTKVASAILGLSKSTVIDSGIQFGGSVNDLQSGVGYEQYATIETVKKKLFGAIKSSSTSTQTQALSDELSSQFALIFTNVEGALAAAADSLGVGADHVTNVLDGLSIDMTKVSLKGLSGDELTEALNAVLSKAMDDMAEAVFPELDGFRQVGEGYAETVVRLASDYGRLDAALTSTGDSFGAVGLSSLAAREQLIALMGGIDQVEESTASFAENYLTEAERLAPVQSYVTEQLASMGLASVTTRDQFKDVVLGLDKTTQAGAEQYAALMSLESAFAATHEAIEDLTRSAQDIADERTGLQDRLDAATLTSVQLQERQRAAIDGSNLALYDQVVAAESAKTASDSLASANADLQTQIDAVLRGRMNEAEIRALDTAGMAESTVALYDRLAALNKETAAIVEYTADRDEAQANVERLGDSLAQIMGAVDKSIQDVLKAAMDGLAGIQNSRASVQASIRSAQLAGMTPADRLAALRGREEELFSQLGTASDPSEVAAQLQSVITDRIKEQVALSEDLDATATNTIQTQIDGYKQLKSMAQELAQFTGSMRFSDLSPLSNEDQLDAAAALYKRTLEGVEAGNADAISNFTGNAQAYIEEARDYFGSSSGFVDIFESVMDSIDAVATADYDPQLDALNDQLEVLHTVDASVKLSSELTVDAMGRLDAGLAEREARQQETVNKQLALAQAQIEQQKQIVAKLEAQIAQASAVATTTLAKMDDANAKLAQIVNSARMEEARV